jgi:hypothetical protein
MKRLILATIIAITCSSLNANSIFDLTLNSAKKGDAGAQTVVGNMYRNGENVPYNDAVFVNIVVTHI